jgi:hypothetical protein
MGKRQFAVMTGYSDEEMIGKTRTLQGLKLIWKQFSMREQILKGCLLVVKLLITLKGEKYWVNIGASFI